MEKKTLSDRALAACPVLAVMLHLALTEWGTQQATTYCNGQTKVISGPAGKVLWSFWESIADTMGMMGTSCDVRAFDTAEGLFARGSISPTVAIFGGVILPILLVGFTAYKLIREFHVEGRTRMVVAATMTVLGLASIMLPLVALALNYKYISFTFYIQNVFPIDAAFILPGLILIGGGIWLWRTRSPRKPA